ncbi:MAG: nucleotidyltransferase family protein [Rhodobacteraceae bacterium]|nr:nucleotidyltransferase family protein [Paracoccaceae bacterium]
MRDHPSSVIIFAAGFGTRMGPLTADQPKPLLEVAGRPMIDHAIALAGDAGIGKITVNIHYKSEMLRRHLSPLDIGLSHEVPDILDTGGGLRHALPLTGEGSVFTLNPDTIWRGPNPLTQLAKAWRPELMDALLMLIPPERALGHRGCGDFVTQADGRLTRGPGLVYSGVQIVKTGGLHEIKAKAFSLNVLWDIMKQNGRLFGLTYEGSWCDVGSPEGIDLAEGMLGYADV